MKKEQADKLLKDKLNGLSTLEGGMVFAKEEAWDKLQSRLDTKPERRKPLIYWFTAAAVLLLMVSIMVLFRQPEQQVVNTKTNNEVPKPVVVDTGNALNSQLIVVEDTPSFSIAHPGHQRMKLNKTPEQLTETFMITDTPKPQLAIIENNSIPIVDTEINSKPPVVSAPTVAKVKMKVVHINELNNPDNEPEYPAVLSTTPSISILHMKVLHINELGLGEPEKDIRFREYRNSPIRITFFNNLIRDTQANYGKLAY